MSKMIPPYFDPASVSSQAERDLFARMRDSPGTEDWIVLHSLALGEHLRQRAGEIDFLVITPLGVFVLEVKGGMVRRENGLWIYGSSLEDRTIKPRGPFEQARDAMFSLEDRLHKKGSGLAKLFFGYGVVAPDCSLKACVSRSDGAENPGVVYDFDDRRSSLPEYIKRLAAEANKRYAAAGIQDRFRPSKKDSDELVSLLRGDFEAEVSDSARARDIHHNVILLEEKQREALESFVQDKRAIILGAAGTGKTVIAVEAALLLSLEGKKVLLLTYNKNLAHYISAKIQDSDSAKRPKISSIHDLMVKTLEESAFSGELQKIFSELETKPREEQQSFWNSWLPEHFSLVQSDREPLCDVAIVDEGQDILTDNYLNAVDVTLSGGLSEGSWLWCMDDGNQGAVYGRCNDDANRRLRGLGVAVRLRENIRNTRQISEAARKLAGSKGHADAALEGSAVVYYRVHNNKEERKRLLSVLRNLLADGVIPGQITVLSVHKNPAWDFQAVLSELPNAVWVDEEAARQLAGRQVDGITFSTISAFKGLENDFVIVTEIDDLTSERARALAYVGMTRARAKLIVLLSPEADACRLREEA